MDRSLTIIGRILIAVFWLISYGIIHFGVVSVYLNSIGFAKEFLKLQSIDSSVGAIVFGLALGIGMHVLMKWFWITRRITDTAQKPKTNKLVILIWVAVAICCGVAQFYFFTIRNELVCYNRINDELEYNQKIYKDHTSQKITLLETSVDAIGIWTNKYKNICDYYLDGFNGNLVLKRK